MEVVMVLMLILFIHIFFFRSNFLESINVIAEVTIEFIFTLVTSKL